MKGKSILVSAMVLVASGPAFGAYSSIQHNLIDGIGDTYYTAPAGQNPGHLWVDADSNALTLNDPGALPGTITLGHVFFETWLDRYEAGTAIFRDGSYELTFNYDGGPYEMSGNIYGMELVAHYQTPTYSYIDGQALWKALVKDLPGSGDWPDGGGPSSMTTLTLVFGLSLEGFEWSTDIGGPLRAETTYTLWPDDRAVPEPASLLLLAVGSLVLLRRRRG